MVNYELMRHAIVCLALLGFLTACGSPPPPPQMRAYKAQQQAEKIVYVNTRLERVDVKQESEAVIRATYNIQGKAPRQPNAYALVVGITKYQNATPVTYADYSAFAFKELATKALGVPEENILLLVNEEATSGQVKSKIELIKELADEGSKIYVYFAGHGVPGRDSNSYLLPADMSADAIHLEPGLMLNNIYQRLAMSKADNVYVFVDSCFSGKDDRGELLYKGVAPVLRTSKTTLTSNKLTIISAGGSSDFANDLKEKKQRMFTYYLIKALESGEKHIDSVFPQIQAQVKRASLMKGIGYKQVPELAGKTNASLY